MPEISARTLGKAELFARLERGHCEKITVVTPNRRLAQALAADFDRHQAAKGPQAWEPPDLLPLSAFIERLYEDVLFSEDGATLPLLLTEEQQLALWEAQIRQSKSGRALLAVPEAASLASQAWELVHAWHLMPALATTNLDEDAAAFAEWAARYVARTERERLIERARLPSILEPMLELPCVQKPALLVAWGFDMRTPQQEVFFAALAARGVELATGQATRRETQALRIPCVDAAEELRLAARWARARLEEAQRIQFTVSPGTQMQLFATGGAAPEHAPRIAIVVPDLPRQRNTVRRILRETLVPGAAVPGEPARALPFNISLGEPLASYPVVEHALLALELTGREIEYERVSLLLRSPFIAGGETEAARRSALDAALRRRVPPAVSLDRLLTLLARSDTPAAPILLEKLTALARFRRERLFAQQDARAWGVAFSEALELMGLPGERSPDSAEFQTLAKWHELLAQFARLERVLPKIGYSEALARLRRMAAATDFQPESPAAPIQVLGVLEAAGAEFDHLWVSGLTDEAWPLHPRVNPFVPFRAQRAAGVPNASPAESLAVARKLTAGWLAGPLEAVLSFPQREGDRDLEPSPLILHVAPGELRLPAFTGWRERIRAAAALDVASLERVSDQAPPAAERNVRGAGVSLLRNQAACPFRAFARHRLGADPMEAPHAGLDPRERGTLVHALLAALWRELGTKERLDALNEAELDGLLDRSAAFAIERGLRYGGQVLSGRFGAIERERLARLARGWLDYERGVRRAGPDFRAVALEERREIELEGLRLNVRLDRVDETANGERIVIDYKTAAVPLRSILHQRPEEPQLPLYLITCEPAAEVVAFAQVRAGDMKFVGLARVEGGLSGARTPQKAARYGAQADWRAQRVFWQQELSGLARSYLEGRAEVDPKRAGSTCRECELQILCRISERAKDPDAGCR